MYDQIINFAVLVGIGAAIGLILSRFAPKACQRFHDFSVSSSSKPLHLLSIVFFGLCALTGILTKDYIAATLSVLITIVSFLAFNIVKRNDAVAGREQPAK